MRIDCLSLFPEMLEGFISSSMVGKAVKSGLVNLNPYSLRDWADPPHFVTDDRPFGGGAGMVLKPEPIARAITALREQDTYVIYLSPEGNLLCSKKVQQLAKKRHLILLSGHYEGVDQRVRDTLIDEEISIGDYILTNGTLPAAVLMDALVRYVPGVLGEEKSLTQDSFCDNLLGIPQYTRPAVFEGMGIPEVLRSGNHAEIEKWRAAERVEKTRRLRPDLLAKAQEELQKKADTGLVFEKTD